MTTKLMKMVMFSSFNFSWNFTKLILSKLFEYYIWQMLTVKNKCNEIFCYFGRGVNVGKGIGGEGVGGGVGLRRD